MVLESKREGPFGHSFKKTAALVLCICMEKRILSDKLHSFFSNIIRRSFWQLGINDAAVVGYVADVLIDFAKSDNLYRMRVCGVRKVDSMVEMLVVKSSAAIDESQLLKECSLQKSVGDYTLF